MPREERPQDLARDEPSVGWHTLSVEESFIEIGSGPAGLSSEEAARRLGEYGPNELETLRRISPWAVFFQQFKNTLIVVLIIATVLSAVLGHEIEAIAIATILLLAVLLGFVQEYRAERALEALREMAAPTADVLRDGREVEVPARDVVPGDVVLLAAGDRVPADGRVVEAVNLEVDEASLTGESMPVAKGVAPLAEREVPVGDRRNSVFAGTAATHGRGRLLVTATGMGTEFGKIARLLQTVETSRTPLQENLDRVGAILARAALVITLAVVALGAVRGQPLIEMLIFGVALAVAVVPEALPAVVTISLALGVKRMVARGALVRKLSAVETLGSTSVICSDKTGTLTKDEMTVREIYAGGRTVELSGAGYEPKGEFSVAGRPVEPGEAVRALLLAGVLASDAQIGQDESGYWTVKGDPTEGALVVAAAKAGLSKTDLERLYPRLHEIPFTSERKRMTTLHSTEGEPIAHSKGAPEVILESCSLELSPDGESELDAAARGRIVDAARVMARKALRVLGIATKDSASPGDAEHGMTFLGLVGLMDPPRPEAKTAIEVCEGAGIRPVMITGDHPITAEAIARELGLLKGGRVVTGAELSAMSDEDFLRDVETIDVYARVSPADKLRVVTALQEKGHVAAMTGDGVNDAPALKKADIGIAMGITGTDVSKEAAAMTITDDNFASIVAAVEEGRGIFGNIKKCLTYLLSSNIGEIGLVAGATLMGLPMPLTAVQILYVNLATDGLPALALAVDPHEPDLMRRKPRNPRVGVFTRPVVLLMLTAGAWATLVNLGLFRWALSSGRTLPQAMTMTFVSLVFIQFLNAYNFRSDRASAFRRPHANGWLNLAVFGQSPLLLLIVYVPALQAPFATSRLAPVDWAISLAVAGTIVPVIEVAKWVERRGWFGRVE